MDDRRVGRALRAIRRQLGLRQSDVAVRARMSQRSVSEIELGRLEHVSLGMLRRVGEILDVRVSIDMWWRAGRIDHLLDRDHAALVELIVRGLRADGWVTRVELTFNHFGERGSVDIVAWDPVARVLLIIEVKTRIDDVQELHATFHRKLRIVPAVVAKEEGWVPITTGRILVVLGTHANRDAVATHRATFDTIWPDRTAATTRWIAQARESGPDNEAPDFGGIWFVPATTIRRAPAPRGRARPTAASTPEP